jgi:hypothetical protein
MVGRKGSDPEPDLKKMTVPDLPMKTITVIELLTKNITVLELPMKVLYWNSRNKINVSRIPILHNPEFTIADIGGVVDHHCLNFLFFIPQANGSRHLCYNKLIILWTVDLYL